MRYELPLPSYQKKDTVRRYHRKHPRKGYTGGDIEAAAVYEQKAVLDSHENTEDEDADGDEGEQAEFESSTWV